MALTLGFTRSLSSFIAQVFEGLFGGSTATLITEQLFLMLAFGIGRGLLIWVQEWLSARAASRAKSQLRARLLAAISSLGPTWMAGRNTAEIGALATTQLDSLDAYFAKFLPQLVYSALITPVLTAVIFWNDFWSGVAVVCTLPLIPLFMIFIGWATRDVQQKQLDAMTRLSRHFAEVLKGLTTLKVFGRLEAQPRAIFEVSEDYRSRTLKVLRVSFLSGFALEVAASLSVALIAVSIGLRLINGELNLATGLFVLLLAPEVYLPIRMVGANFHASNEGVVASKRILDIIDEATAPSFAARAISPETESRGQLAVKAQSALSSLLAAQPGEIVRLTGASGTGKTRTLDRLRSQLDAATVSWLPQTTRLLPGTVLANIVGPTERHDEARLSQAINLAALDDVPLGREVSDTMAGLSGGQAQRVAIARVFYRALGQGSDWLLLDEPLSGLDQERADVVTSGLRNLAQQGMRVIVISHQAVPDTTRTVGVVDV